MNSNPVNDISQSLPPSASSTLEYPKPTAELDTVQQLNSKNFVTTTTDSSGKIVEQAKPDVILDKDIAAVVAVNTPSITECITSKIKDLLGVFTVAYGVPSFDQFDTEAISGQTIKEAFNEALSTIKDTVKSTIQGIKDALKFNNQSNLDQIETGKLSLRKFLGCQETNVDFTPRQRQAAIKKPEIITDITNTEVDKSVTALSDQTKENVIKRVTPPQSAQQSVGTLTVVE